MNIIKEIAFTFYTKMRKYEVDGKKVDRELADILYSEALEEATMRQYVNECSEALKGEG